MKSIFKKESFTIFKNRQLLIALIAIIFVPILYAGMFLWAFWDPYNFLDDIPVAIVNEDEGYLYEDEYLKLGQDLVDELKDSADFDFHFVSKDEGYEGLEAQDYYILIEIPSNFSKQATTVTEDSPEQLELIYVPNESYNFLASQMGETAMLQIEQALEEEIIEAYASVIFDTIDEVTDGLVEAKDATEELNDGAHELKEGTETIVEHLQTAAEGSITLKEGVFTAQDGAGELATGAETLSEGVTELYDNSVKLRDASTDIQTGAKQLADGLNSADAGVNELTKNIPLLIDGTGQIQDGLKQFQTELPKQMANQLSKTVQEQSGPVRQTIDEKLSEKAMELSPLISDRLTEEISSGAAQTITKEVNHLIDNAPDTIATNVSAVIVESVINLGEQRFETIKEEIYNILDEKVEPEVIEQIIATVEENINMIDKDQLQAQIESTLQTILDKVLADKEITAEQQKQLEKNIAKKATPQIEAGVIEALDSATDTIDKTLDDYEDILLENIDDVASSLETQLAKALNEPMGLLQDGVDNIQDGQRTLYTGVQTLQKGTSELADGSNQLVSGQNDYVANMNKFTSSFTKAKDGAIELSAGAYELYKGMNELYDGASQLSEGTNELAEGSEELKDGMTTLADGTKTFHEEMSDATDRVDEVNLTKETEQMIADPVTVNNKKINEVPNYGTGFAPYFLSLGLFVGALLLSIVYPLREPSTTPSSGFTWFLRKFLVLLVIGIFQALIASAILLLGLGLEVQSVPRFILFAILTSLTFITLVQFLVTCFDDPGRFMAIIVLILQLTTSAGTFPLELIPKVLQPINLVLPMTYSVAGFKAVISSGDFAVMGQNALVLIGFIIGAMLLTLSYFVIQYKRKYEVFNEPKEQTTAS